MYKVQINNIDMKNIDSQKLVKSIQILIKEELKLLLPKLVKEVVNSEVKKKTRLIERKLRKELKENLKQQSHSIIDEEEIEDPFEKAQKLLEQDRQVQSTSEQNAQPKYTSNKTINEILAETAKSYTPGGLNKGATPPSYGHIPNYNPEPEVEESTLTFNSEDVHTVASKSGNFDRASMAAKMGYGNMNGNKGTNITTVGHTGKHINPDDEKVAPIMQAMNRDYSELVKRFKK